jgi:hypothetical protein
MLELGQLHRYKKAVAKVEDLKTASLKFADSSSDGAMNRVPAQLPHLVVEANPKSC